MIVGYLVAFVVDLLLEGRDQRRVEHLLVIRLQLLIQLTLLLLQVLKGHSRARCLSFI